MQAEIFHSLRSFNMTLIHTVMPNGGERIQFVDHTFTRTL